MLGSSCNRTRFALHLLRLHQRLTDCIRLWVSTRYTGGWPSFSSFLVPFRNCGCPVLAFFARAGRDAAHTTLVPSAETALRMRSWFPPFANCAKDGAPPVLVVPARSKVDQPPNLLELENVSSAPGFLRRSHPACPSGLGGFRDCLPSHTPSSSASSWLLPSTAR